MSMQEGHDYVVVTSWRCPYCHEYWSLKRLKIGRAPFGNKLKCQECAMECTPQEAELVTYE